MVAQHQTEVEIEVPFHDIDGIHYAWHGHYYKYFEIARTELLRSINYDVPEMAKSGYQWPVIETHCRYIQPLQYGQHARVIAVVQEYEYRLKIAYRIVDSKQNTKVAKGYTIQVAVDIDSMEMCLPSPPVLLKKLGVIPS